MAAGLAEGRTEEGERGGGEPERGGPGGTEHRHSATQRPDHRGSEARRLTGGGQEDGWRDFYQPSSCSPCWFSTTTAVLVVFRCSTQC
ncbi:unnamed protein product [Pleuronectes platessa]|uniref:Uncharacterized protein n=1 Tax=Pleuronectes platessa TaxID=8262 RepID=A0A9N7U2B9_PLEPL|nr:unnamed protein product [Pleuronectes platessa]